MQKSDPNVHRHNRAVAATAIACLTAVILGMVMPNALAASWPHARFAVISDIHIYDPSLGTQGAAFEGYLADDRKMLAESVEIGEAAVDAIARTDVDFVLVSGDLTKDGELASHERAVSLLTRLVRAGKKVYVVPGKHDIDNAGAVRYLGSDEERVPTVTATTFASMYSAFGRDDAVTVDPSSLSYVAEPVPGLWVLALDSCTYASRLSREGVELPDTETPLQVGGGLLSSETKLWTTAVLKRARRENKAVIAVMHHGVVEHFSTESTIFSRWLLSDYTEVGRLLADGGVAAVFTGHFHAQDITARRFTGGRTLYDIETGSLVTAPSPYRLVEIDPRKGMRVTTKTITAIPSHPDDFVSYSQTILNESLRSLSDGYLAKLMLGKGDRQILTEPMAQAFRSHFVGDEGSHVPIPAPPLAPLTTWGRLVWTILSRTIVKGLQTDINTPDNDAVIPL